MKRIEARRRLIRWGTSLYVAISLVIILPFAINEQLRFQYIQLLAHWNSRIVPPTYVFLGDSITGGGRNWGWSISGNPFDAINLGVSSYMTRQTGYLLDRAISYKRKFIVLMSGTNDVFDSQYNLQHTIADFDAIFNKFKTSQSKLVLFLTPLTTDAPGNRPIMELNRAVRDRAKEYGIIVVDLNGIIAPEGVLLNKYTIDGVHFSGDGYKAWTRELINISAFPRK